jgi:hypothetical protein
MMRILAVALATGMLLGAGQASATEDPTAGAPVPPPSAAPPPASRLDPNQVVCKRQEQPGSRLGGAKICRTRQEWADIAAASRTTVDRMQSGASLSPQH